MPHIDRLPAIPLLASDPYISVWMPADTMTQTDSCHWSGPAKPIRGAMTVDGGSMDLGDAFIGAGLSFLESTSFSSPIFTMQRSPCSAAASLSTTT